MLIEQITAAYTGTDCACVIKKTLIISDGNAWATVNPKGRSYSFH